MKLKAEQLDSHLAAGLVPVYIVSGDELLLVQEAADAIRAAARQQGYATRELMHVDKSFDWQQLLDAAGTMSLFAERKIVELRMPTGKPGDAGRKALMAWCERPPEDTLLLIITGKLDAATQKTKWYTTLEQAGVALTLWPLELRQLPGWLGARLRQRGLEADAAALDLLAERVEGNLLAAAQEIEKLHLLHGEGRLRVDDIADAVTDNARFDIYRLMDTALEGDSLKTARTLERLREEGIEPVLVLWVIARELRTLAQMATDCAPPGGGRPDPAAVDQAMTRARVWQRRKILIKKALMRHGPKRWQAFVLAAGHADKVIKGQAPGNVWDELLQLCLAVTGNPAALALNRSTLAAS
ncbi:MAG: DNA polymerase III subunit delta [Granulosicoccaceae bacterium]|jgi:DNA polymerase-3 subunit delta